MNQKISKSDRQLIIDLVHEREKARRQVRELTNKKIAAKFDIHPNTVCKIVRLWCAS